MDMLPSLCAAMQRAGGECLVLREGQPPHVVSGTTRHDVARAVLSHNALEALVGQIFSESSRQVLSETGQASESVDVPGMNLSLTAKVETLGNELSIQLSRDTSATKKEEPPTATMYSEPVLVSPPAWSAPSVQVEAPALDAPSTSSASTAEPSAVPTYEIHAQPDTKHADELWASTPTTKDEPAIPAMPAVKLTPVAPSVAQQPVIANPLPFVQQPLATNPPRTTSSVPAPHVNETDLTGLMRWVAKAASSGATALYLRAGTTPIARVEERLEPLGTETIDGSMFEQLFVLLDSGVDRLWQRGADGEWIRNEDALGRVSCKFFSDDLGPGLIVRLRRNPAASTLHRYIPRKVKGACDGEGLVVVSAATPADLLAISSAVADYAGRRRGGYVIALRPEGTARHDIAGAFVSQREFNGNDADIAVAIRNAVAESPDVLFVAPPHSDTAMREVVHATDAGRLVILAVLAPTSMHALRAIAGRSVSGGDTPNRLALATAFRAAFSYRGMRRLGGGRTLIQDLLIGTSDVSALLASGDFAGITRIQRSGSVGMHTVDETLARAVKRGYLSLRQAATQAVDRRHLISLVRTAHRASPARASRSNDGSNPVLLEDLLQAVGSSTSSSRRRWAEG